MGRICREDLTDQILTDKKNLVKIGKSIYSELHDRRLFDNFTMPRGILMLSFVRGCFLLSVIKHRERLNIYRKKIAFKPQKIQRYNK